MVSLTDAVDEDDAFTIIGLFLFAYESVIHGISTHFYASQGTSTSGPYTIKKSNALEVMFTHENDQWYWQFFWYDSIL
jgi:hypothetical protein